MLWPGIKILNNNIYYKRSDINILFCSYSKGIKSESSIKNVSLEK